MISYLLLNIFTLLLGSLSFSLNAWIGEGWAVGVHAAHLVTNAWMISQAFLEKPPWKTLIVVAATQAVADGASAFLGLVVFSRCISSEVDACFERLPQSLLVFLLGATLSVLGIFKILTARESKKSDEPPADRRRRRQLVIHLLSLVPYVFYLTLSLPDSMDAVVLFLPMVRIAFVLICIASRWGFQGDTSEYEFWSVVLGVGFSVASLFGEYEEQWENDRRLTCVYLFVLFDVIRLSLVEEVQKEKQS